MSIHRIVALDLISGWVFVVVCVGFRTSTWLLRFEVLLFLFCIGTLVLACCQQNTCVICMQ